MGASSVCFWMGVWRYLGQAGISRTHFNLKNMIGILELLKKRGLDLNAKIKYVRHQDKRYDVTALIRANQLETYQGYQEKPIFKDCSYIVVFIGQENMKALFYGIYQVLAQRPASEVSLPNDFIYPDFNIIGDTDVFYDLKEIDGFDDLKNRAVVDWGKGALAWSQWVRKNGTVELKDKEVTEILPTGYVKEFPGFEDFVLRYDDLQTMVNNPEANREWHTMLSSVAGIYLIMDTEGGQQYIGSAYGKKGILGRWKEYSATNGHGGNKLLKKILKADPTAAKHFQFTILRTLPKTLTNKEVINYENLYKKKLGTRVFGLNASESATIKQPHQELFEILESHKPLAIFPFGIEIEDDATPMARVVAEGFIVTGGFFFFDVGWNAPMAGTGTDHLVEGKITGPFKDQLWAEGDSRLVEYSRYWKIYTAFIFELTNGSIEGDSNLYRQAEENRARVERVRKDKYKNRDRARELSKQYLPG